MGKRRAAKKTAKKGKNNGNGANLGFEATLWAAADKLRGHMDAAEYKHVVLGLIFLKYISDAFQEKHDQLAATAETDFTDPEDRDEYQGANIFWVPKEARWAELQNNAKQPTIGKLVDDAMVAIERDNPSLKGVLPKQYARPSLDKQRLGELIDLVATIGLGDAENRSKDILGRATSRRSEAIDIVELRLGHCGRKIAALRLGHAYRLSTGHGSIFRILWQSRVVNKRGDCYDYDRPNEAI